MADFQSMELSDDERREIAVSYGTIIGTGVLSLIICVARLITRAVVVKNFGIDDWACLVALSFTTAFNGIGIAIVANGAGRHVTHMQTSELALWFKLYYACTCLSLIIALAVKASLLLYLQRLFPTRYIQRLIPGILIFMVLITVSFSFVDAFECNPPKYVYDLEFVMAPDRAKHCLPADTVYGVFLFQAIILFALDIAILLLPIPVIWSLNVQHGKGILALLIFVPAIIACIAPTLRFQSLDFLKSQDSDITYHSASALYWQAIEYNLGMVAGSLGCLRPLFKRIGTIGKKLFDTAEFSPSSYKLDDAHEMDGPAAKKRSVFRVQGDSVLNTVTMATDHKFGDSADPLTP